MCATVYLGTIHEDLWSIAWRVQRLACDVAILVWLDDRGDIYVADNGAAPTTVTPTMFIGSYKPGVSVRSIEDDLKAAQQGRSRDRLPATP